MPVAYGDMCIIITTVALLDTCDAADILMLHVPDPADASLHAASRYHPIANNVPVQPHQ